MRKKLIEAYKIFRIENGELYSSVVRGNACIHYKPGKKSGGKIFTVLPTRKRKLNPIFAFRTLEDTLAYSKPGLPDMFEIWEIEGTPWKEEFIGWATIDYTLGMGYIDNFLPINQIPELPEGTILLHTCIPVRKIERRRTRKKEG